MKRYGASCYNYSPSSHIGEPVDSGRQVRARVSVRAWLVDRPGSTAGESEFMGFSKLAAKFSSPSESWSSFWRFFPDVWKSGEGGGGSASEKREIKQNTPSLTYRNYGKRYETERKETIRVEWSPESDIRGADRSRYLEQL